MQIREKSERSVPMGQLNQFRGNSTSDYSFSDQADSSGAKSRPRSRITLGCKSSLTSQKLYSLLLTNWHYFTFTATGSKPNSRPGSRHSSRPPSRAGSDLSTESLDGYQQRRATPTRTKLGSNIKRTPSFGKTNGTNGTPRERWK